MKENMNKTINKTIFLVLAIALLVSIIQVPKVNALTVSLSKYEPYPAVPGQTVKAWFLVQNTDNNQANNIKVELAPQYPFSLYGTETAVKTIPTLGSNRDYLIDYTLKVDDNAVQGDNILKVRYSSDNNNQVEQDISMFVQSKDATVTIDSVKFDPTELSPGSQGKLTISVKNTAPTTLTDMSMKLYLQATVSGTIIDLPFAPVDSTAEKRIYKLETGQTTDFIFDLKAYPDAVSKVYKIPFLLTYYDSLGNQKNKSDFIGVTVNSIPDVSLYVDKTDLTQQKRAGSVTVKVVNKGLSDIKFLNLQIQKSNDFDLLSNSDTTYVGNLVSDDYQTVEYKIDIKSSQNTLILPITVQYRDSNNKVYESTQNVQLTLVDNSKLNNANNSGSSVMVIVIVIIIVGVLIWIFVRNKNKKNKKAQFN